MAFAKKDFLWAVHTFRLCPYYPWEILTKDGRMRRYNRLNERMAYQVERSARELGMEIPTDWDSMDETQLWEVLVERPYFVEGFEPSHVVIDIGAKYGEFGVLSSLNPSVSKVYSFEPLPLNFKKMAELIRLNGGRVDAFPVALGDVEGIKSGKIEGGMFSDLGIGDSVEVETKTLDSYHFEDIGLMKIDVEGMEMHVLRGSIETIRRSLPRIIIEVHSSDLKAQVDDFLSNLGYKKVGEGKKGKGIDRRMDLVQNVFYSHP